MKMIARNNIVSSCILAMGLFLLTACANEHDRKLEYAIRMAGPNGKELTKVLNHYKNQPDKLAAARFLIENMPGHYSYMDDDDIELYYDQALELFNSTLTPSQQRDSLLKLSDTKYNGLQNRIIQDVKIIKSDYLIYNIDKSFDVWENAPWAKHLDFDEFCEWILPYKCSELQALDCWRDTMAIEFSNDLNNIAYDDETCNSPFRAVNVVRNEIVQKVKPLGMFNRSGHPMLSASTLKRMTFGRCLDYVNLGVLTYRSLGIPAVIDETPIWGRYRTGHNWYVILDEKGDELKSEWDISSQPGMPFFPYQRIPKVYRYSYAPNSRRVDYLKRSIYQYPFSIFQKDVTDDYYSVTDVTLRISNELHHVEKYAYIAVYSGHNEDWKIVDFGKIRNHSVTFERMGRNVLYMTFVFDGNALVPISEPFIIHSNGNVDFVHINPDKRTTLELRRKYYSSENVVNMHNRLVGGIIQASNNSSFINCDTILSIKSADIPDKNDVLTENKYRYWRYYSPKGSYGNIAELAFYDKDSTQIFGRIISSDTDSLNLYKVFDNDWLSFFDSYLPDGNWIGLDFSKPVSISHIRIVPRGDDNDIHPGDEYHLRMWDGHYWVTVDKQTAVGNSITYRNIIDGCLYSIHDATRGWDERPFIYRDGTFEWW